MQGRKIVELCGVTPIDLVPGGKPQEAKTADQFTASLLLDEDMVARVIETVMIETIRTRTGAGTVLDEGSIAERLRALHIGAGACDTDLITAAVADTHGRHRSKRQVRSPLVVTVPENHGDGQICIRAMQCTGFRRPHNPSELCRHRYL